MNDGLMTFIFFVFLASVIVIFSAGADSTRCREVGKALNYQTEWRFWSGCVVTKPDGNKVLLRQMRDVDR